MLRRLARPRLVLGVICFATVTALTLGGVAAQGLIQGPNRPQISVPAPPKQASGVTPKQMARLQERIALVNGILDEHQAEAQANGAGTTWRQAYLEMLFPIPLEELTQLRGIKNLNQLSGMAVQVKAAAAAKPAVLGSSFDDLVYVPIAPCRYVDTRNIFSPITGTRGYDLAFNGSSYGGNGGCNPIVQFNVNENQFGALAMNVTIVGPFAPAGYAAVKPSVASPLTSAINWYEPGAIIANQGIYATDQTGAAAEFVVETSSTVHVILDIFGAFISPEATPLNHQLLISTAQAVSAGAFFSVFSPHCPANFQVVGGGHLSNNFNEPSKIAASRPAANDSNFAISGFNAATQWLVQGTAGVAMTLQTYVVCAQVPGR